MNRVTIMRGIPGSGKSTWHRANRPDAVVCSADNYHIDNTGVYRFDPAKIGFAHDCCLKSFLAAIHANAPDIVVDNTNVRVWEIAPYYRIAEAFGFDVMVMWLLCNPALGTSRTIHGVPSERVFQMANSFEPLPSHWKVCIV